jgi:hypothetical protein
MESSVKLRFEEPVKVKYAKDNLFSETAIFINIKELQMIRG